MSVVKTFGVKLSSSEVEELKQQALDQGKDFVVVYNSKGQSEVDAWLEESEKHKDAILIEESDLNIRSQPTKVENSPSEQKMDVKSPEPVIPVGEIPNETVSIPALDETKFSGLSTSIEIPVSATFPTIKFKDRPVCLFSLDTTERDMLPYLSYGLKIKSFNNDKSFQDAKIDLTKRVIDTYSGVFKGMSDRVDPLHSEYKIPEDTGFDLIQLLNRSDISNRDRSAVYDMIPKLAVTKIDIYNKQFPIVAHPYEHKLQVDFHNLELGQRQNLNELWTWFRNFDNPFRFLKPYSDTLDLNYLVYYHSASMQAYDHLVSRNTTLQKFSHDILRSVVRTFVPGSFTEENEMFRDVLKKMRINPNRYSSVNSIPSRILSSGAKEFLEAIALCLLHGEIVEMDYDILMDKYSIETIIDCLMLKLLVPCHYMSPLSALRVDNYLALHFLPSFKSFIRSRNVDVTYQNCEIGIENYLNVILTDPGRFQNPGNEVVDFLFTDPVQGTGWGTGGARTVSPLPRNHARYLNNRANLCEMYAGERLTYDTDSVRRFEQFRSFIFSISELKLSSYNGQEIGALMPLFVYVAQLGSKFSSLVYTMNQVIEKLAMFSLCKPLNTSVPPNFALPRRKIFVRSMSALSFLLLGDWDGFKVDFVPLSLVAYGWKVHDALEQFVFYWHLVRDRYDSLYYNKDERVQKVIDLIDSTIDIKPMLLDSFMGTTHIKTIDVPPADVVPSFFSERWRLADEFIRMMGHYTGFVDYFYYNPAAISTGNLSNYFATEYLYTGGEFAEISRREYEEMIQTNQLNARVMEIVASGRIVRFNFPIVLKSFESNNLEFPDQIPISSSNSMSAITTSEIYHYYQWADVYFNRQSNDLAFFRAPRFLSPHREKLYESITYLDEFIKPVNSLDKRFKAATEDIFVFVSRY
jgi:hypothetical protein